MKDHQIKQIAIIGTGMIAVSMAVLLTGHGYKTIVMARSDSSSERAKKDFHQYYRDLIQAGLITENQAQRCASYLSFTQDYQEIATADFVIESVFEKLEIKQSVYQQIEQVCARNTVIASMTSGISPDMLSEGMIDKTRMLVAHPFMPPHLAPCVEIVQNLQTSQETIAIAVGLFESVGREIILLNKSIDGFIANRLQHAMFREAVYLVEQKIASAEDIDRAILASFGPRYGSIGLFEHMDSAGLDLVADIQRYLYPTLCNEPGVQTAVSEKVLAGDLGNKSGKGFLDWRKIDLDNFRYRRSQPYFKFFNWKIPEQGLSES